MGHIITVWHSIIKVIDSALPSTGYCAHMQVFVNLYGWFTAYTVHICGDTLMRLLNISSQN